MNKSMTAPRVSVLIPTYNYARYLPEAIESVLEQDFSDFELFISDDCSKDDSGKIISRYAAKDGRIRFNINSHNLGMVQNWNWCLSEARGKYIKFLFGDDRLAHPNALSQLVQLLEANPSAVLASSPRFVIDEHSNVIGLADDLGKPGLHTGTHAITQCLIRVRNLIGEPSAVMFRKRDASHGFNADYNQLADEEMWFHLLETGDVVFAPKPLCCFRRHSRQQSMLNRPNLIGEMESCQLIKDYACKPYLSAKERRSSIMACLYRVQKCRKNCSADLNKSLLEIERHLIAQLGVVWYRIYWLRRRTVRPFQNLRHWCKKVMGKKNKLPLAPWCACTKNSSIAVMPPGFR